MTEILSRDQLVADYKAKKLPGWALCHRWKTESLVLKLGVYDTPTPEAEKSEPEPEQAQCVEQETQQQAHAQETPESPELQEYAVFNDVFRQLPDGERTPLCTGLSFIPGQTVGTAQALFAWDSNSQWASMSFLPRGYWRETERLRYRFVLTTRKTSFRHSMPTLDERGIVQSYDLSYPPAPEPEHGELPLDNRQLCRVGNAMLWALMSTAIRCRSQLRPFQEAFVEFAELPGDLPLRRKFANYVQSVRDAEGREPSMREKICNSLCLGGEATHNTSTMRHRDWFPVPYLAFPAQLRGQLFRTVTDGASPEAVVDQMTIEVSNADGIPVLSPFNGTFESIDSVREDDELFYRMHFQSKFGARILRVSRNVELAIEPGVELEIGDIIGFEPVGQLPADFKKLPLGVQVRELKRSMGATPFNHRIEEWFGRQCLEVVWHYFHVPAYLAGTAAQESRPAQLLWRIDPSSRFWDDASESYVFPAFPEWPLCNYKCKIDEGLVEMDLDLTPDPSKMFHTPCRWFGMSLRRAECFKRRLFDDQQRSIAAAEYREFVAAQHEAELAAEADKQRLLAEHEAAKNGEPTEQCVAPEAQRPGLEVATEPCVAHETQPKLVVVPEPTQQRVAPETRPSASTSTWTCPGCGQQAQKKFCADCGTRRPRPTNCPNCMEAVTEKQKFCGECGAKL